MIFMKVDFDSLKLSYSALLLLTLRGEEKGGGGAKTVTGDEVQGSPTPYFVATEYDGK